MNKKDFIAAVAEEANVSKVSKKDAAAIIDATFKVITDALADGDKISVSGFGTFEVREHKARIGKDPHDVTKTIEIPARKSPAFKPSQVLKANLNK